MRPELPARRAACRPGVPTLDAVARVYVVVWEPEGPAVAFGREVLGPLPREGCALSSQEVCAWLLIRAIERVDLER